MCFSPQHGTGGMYVRLWCWRSLSLWRLCHWVTARRPAHSAASPTIARAQLTSWEENGVRDARRRAAGSCAGWRGRTERRHNTLLLHRLVCQPSPAQPSPAVRTQDIMNNAAYHQHSFNYNPRRYLVVNDDAPTLSKHKSGILGWVIHIFSLFVFGGTVFWFSYSQCHTQNRYFTFKRVLFAFKWAMVQFWSCCWRNHFPNDNVNVNTPLNWKQEKSLVSKFDCSLYIISV